MASSVKEMIVIASDHGGYALKEEIKSYLASKDVPIRDLGCDANESVDYPMKADQLCQLVIDDASPSINKGILVCGTGIGMSIAANKWQGIRCALCHNAYTGQMAREHNDANVLALGGRVLDVSTAKDIVDAYLATSFAGGRHARRVNCLTLKN